MVPGDVEVRQDEPVEVGIADADLGPATLTFPPGAHGLVIDLRGNPGGYLDSAVSVASKLLPKEDS